MALVSGGVAGGVSRRTFAVVPDPVHRLRARADFLDARSVVCRYETGGRSGPRESQMDACDVLIVGGGPAGSACAWGLGSSGLDVAILDKQRFPRDKVCGGWITPAVLSELEIDAADYARGRLLQPITGFRTGCITHTDSMRGSAIDTDYNRTVSFGIRRREFDEYFLRRSGA